MAGIVYCHDLRLGNPLLGSQTTGNLVFLLHTLEQLGKFQPLSRFFKVQLHLAIGSEDIDPHKNIGSNWRNESSVPWEPWWEDEDPAAVEYHISKVLGGILQQDHD